MSKIVISPFWGPNDDRNEVDNPTTNYYVNFKMLVTDKGKLQLKFGYDKKTFPPAVRKIVLATVKNAAKIGPRSYSSREVLIVGQNNLVMARITGKGWRGADLASVANTAKLEFEERQFNEQKDLLELYPNVTNLKLYGLNGASMSKAPMIQIAIFILIIAAVSVGPWLLFTYVI
jgi:hypothetical protein